jgi:hypothetical protein
MTRGAITGQPSDYPGKLDLPGKAAFVLIFIMGLRIGSLLARKNRPRTVLSSNPHLAATELSLMAREAGFRALVSLDVKDGPWGVAWNVSDGIAPAPVVYGAAADLAVRAMGLVSETALRADVQPFVVKVQAHSTYGIATKTPGEAPFPWNHPVKKNSFN